MRTPRNAGVAARTPTLPAAAGALIKALTVTLSTTGLITGADAEYLLRLLHLEEA